MKTLFSILIALVVFTSSGYSKEKPVEAWISYKQVDGRVVEVVKVKTDTGKVYEFYPGLSPSEIPKPENRLPERVSRSLFLISLSFLTGLLTGIAVLWMKMKKLREG